MSINGVLAGWLDGQYGKIKGKNQTTKQKDFNFLKNILFNALWLQTLMHIDSKFRNILIIHAMK